MSTMSNKLLISPQDLFTKDILDYQVKTVRYGKTNYVNLDNAATTPVLKVVEDGVRNYLTKYGSVHRGAGTKSKISTALYEKSRDTIKSFVNAPSDSYVLFTENTTEAMNVAAYFFSFIKGQIAVSAIEHSSSWLPWIKSEGLKALGKKQVLETELDLVNDKIQQLGRKQVLQYEINDQFEFDLSSIEKILKTNRIKVLILTASSNINGYRPEITKIGALAHQYGAYFLVDACQFIQHHPIDMQAMNIDFLAASGHKFYAPFGAGFLIGPKKFFDRFLPYQIGGGNLPYITKEGEFLRYENQLAHDPGTPNAIGAVALALALNELKRIGLKRIEHYEKSLTKRLYTYLKSNPKVELFVSEKHLNTVIPFRIIGMSSIAVAEKLNKNYGIGTRAGSFCVYHVIRNLLKIENESGIVAAVKKGNTKLVPALIRASIGLCNSEADIDRTIEAIKEITA
jgi:cysteine desulfurase